MKENILFVCGSLNQTTQMHKIAQELGAYTCHFAPYYADGLEDFAARAGLLNFTVLGGRHMRESRKYLADNQLAVDERGEGYDYDLVFSCSDLIVQNNIRGKRTVLVQEGITEPEGRLYRLYKAFPLLPRYIANTATNGLSNSYDLFCVASEGYREHFIGKGVRAEKIAVTGIPNFDNLNIHRNNDFPLHNFVLVATTPYRETFRYDNRAGFIQTCIKIANGRPLIFKLHPSENAARAKREINQLAPAAEVYEHGNINPMIANAAVVITQQSTCTFVALALKKEIYTYLDKNELQRLVPIQNGGVSAKRIANIGLRLMHTPMAVLEQVRKGFRSRPKWEKI